MKQPPTYPLNSVGADRVRALAGTLVLPDELQSRVHDGTIAVGEVGDAEPGAFRYRIGHDNFVIVLTSGMMHFYYAVGRALAGDVVIYTAKDGALNKAALKVGQSVELVARTFKQWRKHCQPSFWDSLRRKEQITHATFPIDTGVQNIAERIVTCAELFTIAHEFGHVMLDLGLATSQHQNEEARADEAGTRPYLLSTESRVQKRYAWAGIAFAIRVFQSLKNSGVAFPGYPDGTERLDAMRRVLLADCPSVQYGDEASTIMVATLDQMDHIDERLGYLSAHRKENDWQTRSRMIAVLEEVAQTRAKPEDFVRIFDYYRKRIPEPQMQAVAKDLQAYYPSSPRDGAFTSPKVRVQMHQALQSCIGMMDPAQRALFATSTSGH